MESWVSTETEDATAFLARAQDEAFVRGVREAAAKGTGLYFAAVPFRFQMNDGKHETRHALVFACADSLDGIEVQAGYLFLDRSEVGAALARVEAGQNGT